MAQRLLWSEAEDLLGQASFADVGVDKTNSLVVVFPRVTGPFEPADAVLWIIPRKDYHEKITE